MVAAASRRKRLRRRLPFALAVTVLCGVLFAVVGELGLRAMVLKSDPGSLYQPLPGSARLYGLKPNLRAIKAGVEVATNSLGFREQEYAQKKPAGVRRIAVLGDSVAQGYGVEFRDTFGKRLEASLNARDRAYEVINFSVSGYNTTLELATLREVARAYQPDLVLVEYFLNDAEPRTEMPGATRTFAGGSFFGRLHRSISEQSLLLRQVSARIGPLLRRFEVHYPGSYNDILRSYRPRAAGWTESQQALLGIASEARRIDAAVLVVVFPMMLDFATYPLGPVHDRIAQFCRDHDIAVLDLLPRFEGQEVSELTVFLDGHPNARAHAIAFEAIAERLTGIDPPAPGGVAIAPLLR